MWRRSADALQMPVRDLYILSSTLYGACQRKLPLESLAYEGRLVNIGSAAGPGARFESAILRSKLHAILGYTNNALTHAQKAEALAEILMHAAAGRVTVERETLPLTRAAEAWERQTATARRKLILIPDKNCRVGSV